MLNSLRMPYRDVNGVIYGRYKMKRVTIGPFSAGAWACVCVCVLESTDRSPGQARVSGTSGVKWPEEDTVQHACVLYSSAEQPITSAEAPSKTSESVDYNFLAEPQLTAQRIFK